MHKVMESVIVLIILPLNIEKKVLKLNSTELRLREVSDIFKHFLNEGDVEHFI